MAVPQVPDEDGLAEVERTRRHVASSGQVKSLSLAFECRAE
jgi:hypothetical protein